MYVLTDSGNAYTYLWHSNEIVQGIVDDIDGQWDFAPFMPFSAMPKIESFILSITEQCNLRCTYCCYSGNYANNRRHSTKSMDAGDIDAIYDFIDTISPNRDIRISFYGGEPLLNYALVKYAVGAGYKRWNDKVIFSISTNGVLLTPTVIDWIVDNSVELAISVDGAGQYHDRYRVDKGGKGSFSRISSGLSYIKDNYPEYYQRLTIMMTTPSFREIGEIAEAWHNDPLLRELSPTMINGLAPNFDTGVETVDFEMLRGIYSGLLDVYQHHPEWNVLRVFVNQCIMYWKDRPIMTPLEAVPMATCMPINTKLYIDAGLQIGVCEKMADNYRIGDVRRGVDWDEANSIVSAYYLRRKERCRMCPAVRMCDMCLTAMEHDDGQWDVLCHNERVYTRVFFYLFCEMAERGLIR